MDYKQTLWKDPLPNDFDGMDDFTRAFVETLHENANEKSNYIEDDEYLKLYALIEKARKETILDKLCRALVYIVDLFSSDTRSDSTLYSFANEDLKTTNKSNKNV